MEDGKGKMEDVSCVLTYKKALFHAGRRP